MLILFALLSTGTGAGKPAPPASRARARELSPRELGVVGSVVGAVSGVAVLEAQEHELADALGVKQGEHQSRIELWPLEALAGADVGAMIGVLIGELRSDHPVNAVWAVPITGLVGGAAGGGMLAASVWLMTTSWSALNGPVPSPEILLIPEAFALAAGVVAGLAGVVTAPVVGPTVGACVGTALDE